VALSCAVTTSSMQISSNALTVVPGYVMLDLYRTSTAGATETDHYS
jgi:hypothetical protein